MWIFSTIGFFSVTQVREKPEVLQIRARVRGDLDLLRTQYLPSLTETVELPGRDYPYRAYTDRATLGLAMVQMMNDLSYSNFKSEVMVKQGLAREQLYHDVWHVMFNAERKLEEKERKNNAPYVSRGPSAQSAFDDFWANYKREERAETRVTRAHETREPSFDDVQEGIKKSYAKTVKRTPLSVPKKDKNRSRSRRPTR